MDNDLFQLSWPVDEAGYEIRSRGGDGESLLSSASWNVLQGLGGHKRHYQPLTDRPGLWREFAKVCTDNAGVLAFANKFGLLDENGADTPESFIKSATVIDAIAKRLDKGDRAAAASIFNEDARPQLTAGVRQNEKGRLETVVIPMTLRAALFVQTMNAITGTTEFRRCKRCETWFPFGPGTPHTARKEFCSDRCRVGFNRGLQGGHRMVAQGLPEHLAQDNPALPTG